MAKNLIVVAALAAAMATPSRGGSLSGRVVEDTTGVTIADAIVTVHVLLPDSIALPDTSDASGLYAIENIPPANQIYVSRARKNRMRPTKTIAEKPAARINCTITNAPGREARMDV